MNVIICVIIDVWDTIQEVCTMPYTDIQICHYDMPYSMSSMVDQKVSRVVPKPDTPQLFKIIVQPCTYT